MAETPQEQGELSLATLPKYLSDETSAWELLERLRWPTGGPVCPHCGVQDPQHYFIASRSGERRTAKGNVTYRRIWRCRSCRKQFSVLVGTIFESSKVPVHKWLLAMWLFSSAKNGVSALELQRHLGIAYQTAWFMGHRLREAAKREPLAGMLRGTIVADETWVGGEPKNRHAAKNAELKPRRMAPGELRVNQKTDKTPVLALVNPETGEVRSHVVADVTGHTLRKVISEQVDMAGSVLHTDEGGWYEQLGREFLEHNTVNHSAGEYVRGRVSTNRAEGYFAQLKRSIDGTHHNVSREHLPRYLAEFDFRYSTCKMTDAQRVQVLVDRTAGKRLTYRPLRGR